LIDEYLTPRFFPPKHGQWVRKIQFSKIVKGKILNKTNHLSKLQKRPAGIDFAFDFIGVIKIKEVKELVKTENHPA
jgi:hypothetical protein